MKVEKHRPRSLTPQDVTDIVGDLNDAKMAHGPKMDSARAVLQVVRDTLDGGDCGVASGRNIWQSPDPAKMIRALRHLIHEDGTVDEAAELLR